MVAEKESEDQTKAQIRRVIRIREGAYDRLVEVAGVKHLPLSIANELAINLFADSVEHTYEYLNEKLSQLPHLKIYYKHFEEVFKEADPDTIGAVVNLLKEAGQVSFAEYPFSELDKAIAEINKVDCKKVVPIMRINLDKYPKPTPEIRKHIDEFIEKVKKISCQTDAQWLIDKSFDKDDKIPVKVAIFILKKEESSANAKT